MAAHNDLGRKGEELAANHLQAAGYAIRHRNWRCGHKELDIIAEKDGTLVIVEVKTRRDTDFGNPEDAVDYWKIRRIVGATDAYLRKHAIDLPVRFDVITVTLRDKEEPQLVHIESAFYPPLY